jgi:glycosyltransferase involved in cell wall biosynthesis/ribosomal protein S18 acetylase RimI-like enzyme
LRVAHLTTVDISMHLLLLPQLLALRDAGFDVTAVSAPGPWVAGIEEQGIRHLPWRNATRAWDPRADARALAELVRHFRRERFDLVHTHNPKPGVLGRIAARVARVPHVANTVHGLYATPADPARRRLPVLAAERLAARLSDLELYQSEEDLDWVRRIGLAPPSRSLLLGNGVDLEHFDPERVPSERRGPLRRELGLPEGALVVATVGRLVVEKGFRELFAAAAEIRGRRDDVRFLAIGESDRQKADAIDDAEIERARKHVIFTGWRRDVRDLLAIADVFVLPSWREGMPRSAIEAAAMGKPLVLTDIRGCREVGRHGTEAVLVPPRDPAALAEAISVQLDEPDLRERLGAAARRRALERFDERPVVELVVGETRRLLTGSVPGGLRVRRAREEDGPALARLHREALPKAFLPSLGDGFLTRLYRALAADRGAVVLVADKDGEVRGFGAGVVSGRQFARRFCLRHGVAAVASVLRRPGTARRALARARYRAGSGELPDPELLSLAVDPGLRAAGMGRRLADGVLSRLAELGADRVRIVVAADNPMGNGLCADMGFRRQGQLMLHDGRPSNVWVA